MFQIETGFDLEALARQFQAHGRLQIVNFLSRDSAGRLLQDLAGSSAWRLTVNRGEEVRDFDIGELSAWPPERRKLLDTAVESGGRFGFQFRYEVIRVSEAAPPLLGKFAEFLSSPAMVEFMRKLTGATDVAFADAHASRYRPGHFLSTHDDAVDSMGRRAAYVLNLTEQWRPDWGGLLQFYDRMGNVSRAYTPGFNILNIFKVPQPHSVSWVTPLAAHPRYAVTGWLRAAT